MNKRILIFLGFIIALITFHAAETKAHEAEVPQPVGKTLKEIIVDSVTENYTDWKAVAMSGKLSSPLLPLSPVVKVYMEKDSLLLISISVSLAGEVARIEIDPYKAIVVNKWKNTYATVEMEMVESFCPGGLTALQNLFLGRVTIIGEGQLSKRDCDKIEIYNTGDTSWTILPDQDLENSPFVYFYNISKKNMLPERFALLSQDGQNQADFFYRWTERNMILDIISRLNGLTFEATLQLNNPDTNPSCPGRFEPSSKYRKTDLRGVTKM